MAAPGVIVSFVSITDGSEHLKVRWRCLNIGLPISYVINCIVLQACRNSLRMVSYFLTVDIVGVVGLPSCAYGQKGCRIKLKFPKH
jgi:hypothetical protein